MPIKVSCKCGKQLTAKDEFAGRQFKCPGCGTRLVIPRPRAAAADDDISQLLDDAGLRAGIARCPGCGTEMAEEAVLCVMCGFDLRRGHRLKTRVGSAIELEDEDLGELPFHGVIQLDEAERNMARDKRQDQFMMKGVPWWMILLSFLGVVGFTVGMIAMPQEEVVYNSGHILIVAGALITFFFVLRLIIEGFKQSVLTGLIMIVFAPYMLYYVFSRWDRVGVLFIFIAVGCVLSGLGVFMVAVLSPMFEGVGRDRDDEYSHRLWGNRPVAVSHLDVTTVQTEMTFSAAPTSSTISAIVARSPATRSVPTS